jgi:hypothetical protein
MSSRRPPSQRDPAYAPLRVAGTLAQAAPGLKVKNAAPVKARTPNRTRSQAGVSAVLWVDVAANPPTDGSVFWYVTDESC